MKTINLLFISLLFIGAQNTDEKGNTVRKIFDVSLSKGTSYENLRELCKDVGHRLTGSHGDTLAVLWSKKKMETMGYTDVRFQEFETNFWTRGEGAGGKIIDRGEEVVISLLSLGSSVGTNGKPVRGKVVIVESWEELELRSGELMGKIVFYNRRMNPNNINTFHSYGETVDQRSLGAANASEYGALAALVRSVTLSNDDYPHTGNMRFNDKMQNIPGLAISASDANELELRLAANPDLEIEFQTSCANLGMVKSNNVIGEIKGSEFPDEYIVVSGHLDSWDVGDGAHDDGAGVIHALEVIHLFKEIGYRPKRSIRCVLYMNEENGVGGGKKYAEEAKRNGEKHIAAIESDAGAFSPRGFHVDGMDEKRELGLKKLKEWAPLLNNFNLHYFNAGYAGTDIHPLKEEGCILFGLIPDSQRYFDFHHTEADVFEAVNKRELELGCASVASLVYLLDQEL